MKIKPFCRSCLKELAARVVALSGGEPAVLDSSFDLIDRFFAPDRSPTSIANPLLRHIRQQTGVHDPFKEHKAAEFRQAVAARERLSPRFEPTLEGALRSAAFGNGGDFFVDHDYDMDNFRFSGDVAKIADRVYNSRKIVILGDNIGDFVFDIPLVNLLRGSGREVFYAVKEHPVQNDLSMEEVRTFGMERMCAQIVSTGTDEVGIREEEMAGAVRACWQDGGLIIAKGMGNYETISEFDNGRPVVYIMRAKCRSVAEALGRTVGDYIAITGGEHG
jgi:uncharacterized protein with ATP-grasp and redox domains